MYSSTDVAWPYSNLVTETTSLEYLDSLVTNGTLYYYRVTAFDTGNNESGPSNVAQALPNAVAQENPGSCSGSVVCDDATGPADDTWVTLTSPQAIVLDFGAGNGIIDGPGWDLVFYEAYNSTYNAVRLDLVVIEVSVDNATWYPVFSWDGDSAATTDIFGTNIDCYASDDVACNGPNGGEAQQEVIPEAVLYPSSLPDNSGIAIDIGSWTPAGYAFRYVRISDPGGTMGGAQIDAITRLN